MRKQIRTLIIVLAAVLVLTGSLLSLLYLVPDKSDSSSSSDTTSSDTSVKLISKNKDASGTTVTNPVTKASIKNPSEEYTISLNSDNQLVVDKYADLLINTTEMSSLSSDLTSLSATRMITDNSEKAADYGLDTPQATVAVTYYDGSTATLELGDESPLSDGYYLRISGDNAIYLVSTSVGGDLLNSSVSYIGTSVITAPDTNSSDSSVQAVVREMKLSGSVRASKPFTFRVYDAATDSSDLSTFSYLITSPSLQGTGDGVSDITKTSLTATKAVKAYPTKEDLDTYGLSNPYSVCQMELAVQTSASDTSSSSSSTSYTYSNNAEHTVTLGNKDSDGNYYAMVDNYNVIYLVSSSSVPWAATQMSDIASKLLFMSNITSVQSVTVDISGSSTTFDLTHHPDESENDAKLTVTIGDKTYPTSDFRS